MEMLRDDENDAANENSACKEVNGVEPENRMDQTGFLLQRLQELKAWQKEQEERLLREQEEQLDKLYVRSAGSGAAADYLARDRKSSHISS